MIRLRRDDSGFTLIELLVVIIILGIVAAIAIPVFLNQKHKGEQQEQKKAAANRKLNAQICAVNDTQVMTSRGVFNHDSTSALTRGQFFQFTINSHGSIVSYSKVPAGGHVKPC